MTTAAAVATPPHRRSISGEGGDAPKWRDTATGTIPGRGGGGGVGITGSGEAITARRDVKSDIVNFLHDKLERVVNTTAEVVGGIAGDGGGRGKGGGGEEGDKKKTDGGQMNDQNASPNAEEVLEMKRKKAAMKMEFLERDDTEGI